MRRRKLGGAQGKSGSSQDRSTGAKGGCSPGLKPASDRFPRDYSRQSASRATLSASASKGTPAIISRSEEHTSELQSLMRISYAVFYLKNNKHLSINHNTHYSPNSNHYSTIFLSTHTINT